MWLPDINRKSIHTLAVNVGGQSANNSYLNNNNNNNNNLRKLILKMVP